MALPDLATLMNMIEHYMAQLERAMRRERGKRGAHIVNIHEFDRSLIELMQYVHGQLPASAAHAVIAAIVRGILEGHGIIDYGNPS
jgi:hypothetical protein